MSRAVLLPTTADPYRAAVWLASYKKFIQPHVDKLYVCINCNAREEILDYVASMFREVGAVILQLPIKGNLTCRTLGSPEFYRRDPPSTCLYLRSDGACNTPMNWLSEVVEEDFVCFLEDDFYILSDGHVDCWFTSIEKKQIDIIGSFRTSCSEELTQRQIEIFKYGNFLHRSGNLCATPLVLRREDLQGIRDKDYGATNFQPGVYIPELDYTPTKVLSGDAFVWASIQLKSRGLNIQEVPQFPWINVWMQKLANPPWLHTSGGSAIWSPSYLINKDGGCVGHPQTRGSSPTLVPAGSFAEREWRESVHAFFKLASTYFPIPESDPAAFFNLEFTEALEYAIKNSKIGTFSGLTTEGVTKQSLFLKTIFLPLLGD